VKTGETEAGTALVDARGYTLYTLDIDVPNEALCMGYCALWWTPLMAAEDAKPSGPFSLITRASGEWRGELQWAHNGKALYRYTLDIEPGDADGVWPDWVNPNWLTGAHVATP
jgi:predicted lipoprotein with Yx(FWY)xxD motif